MSATTFTLIDEGNARTAPAEMAAAALRLPLDALDFELKPEGLCRGALCYPVSEGSDLVTDAGVDLAAFAALSGRPLALDADAGAAFLGTAAKDRAAALASLEAPDFTLPDLDGNLHSLSDHRGKKVLLVAYASW